MIFGRKFKFRDFAKERYLALFHTYPVLQEERTQMYVMLSLTFAALSFLGFFAINPTLVTITELNRKLEDSKFANQALETKIANISSLKSQQLSLSQSLSLLDKAVPDDPQIVSVLGQTQALAKDTNVSVTHIQAFEVELTKLPTSVSKESSFVYTVTAQGNLSNLIQFIQAVSKLERVVNIESVSLIDDRTQKVTIRARAYFIP